MDQFTHKGVNFTIEHTPDFSVMRVGLQCVYEKDTPENRAHAADQLLKAIEEQKPFVSTPGSAAG